MWQGLHPEVGMFVVAPATSFHHQHPHQDPSLISPDPSHPIQFWQHNNAAYFNKPGTTAGPRKINLGWAGADPNPQLGPAGTINFDHNAGVNLLSSGDGDGGGSGGGGTATCQDCGNQAKKDCSHRRCRTCCRSRGFDCSTHVRSTWVPAARRRERQMMGGGGGGASSGSTSGAKKPRLVASQNTPTTSNSNTPPRSFDTSSSHQDAGFKESLPRQVRAPAVFKCVRVTAVEDGEDEYAYQAVVKIGGHVFKGFLYDQGAESGDGFPNLSELHLGGGGGGGGGRNGASSSSPILDHPEVYGGSGGGFLGGGGGSAYGNTIN